jgi:hypothetical protein
LSSPSFVNATIAMNGKRPAGISPRVEKVSVGEGLGKMTIFTQTVEPKVLGQWLDISLEVAKRIGESVSEINHTILEISADGNHIEHVSEYVSAQGEEAIFEQVGQSSELYQRADATDVDLRTRSGR